ncbi:hypothetical protein [Streptomyces sp. NPDC059916]|uniref:hypothetical protein n=1 Tax=Streptomyces sp. NPDC059916 TaxID=3347001 RepID=UPI00369F5C82
MFVLLAPRPTSVRVVQFRPGLAAEYAAIEEKIGHRFKSDVSMKEIIAEAAGASSEVTAIPRCPG